MADEQYLSAGGAIKELLPKAEADWGLLSFQQVRHGILLATYDMPAMMETGGALYKF